MNTDKKLPKKLVGEARKSIILQKIAQNKPYWDILSEIKEEFNISESTAKACINDSLAYFNSPEFKEVVKSINTARLEKIISESMGEDNKTALKAIDLANKTAGVYDDSVKIEGDVEISFNL